METAQDRALSELRNRLDEIQTYLEGISSFRESIYTCMDECAQIYHRLDETRMSTAGINEKFSKAAKEAIEVSEGPLAPMDLKKFLEEDSFGKPKPDVLPIIRRYTLEVRSLILQLEGVKRYIEKAHRDYKEEQWRLDTNLKTRIDTLIKNMRKELDAEGPGNLTQTTLDTFVQRNGE